jgi:hypothetical protein
MFKGLGGWIGDRGGGPDADGHDSFCDTLLLHSDDRAGAAGAASAAGVAGAGAAGVAGVAMALQVQLLDADVWREREPAQKGYTLHRCHRAKIAAEADAAIAATPRAGAQYQLLSVKPPAGGVGTGGGGTAPGSVPLVKLAMSHEPIFPRGEALPAAFALVHGQDLCRPEPWREDYEMPSAVGAGAGAGAGASSSAGAGAGAGTAASEDGEKKPVMQLLAEHHFSLLVYGHDHHCNSIYSYGGGQLYVYNGRVGSHFPPAVHEGTNWLRHGRGSNVYDVHPDRVVSYTLEETGGEGRIVMGEAGEEPAPGLWQPAGETLVRTALKEWALHPVH